MDIAVRFRNPDWIFQNDHQESLEGRSQEALDEALLEELELDEEEGEVKEKSLLWA